MMYKLRNMCEHSYIILCNKIITILQSLVELSVIEMHGIGVKIFFLCFIYKY
jgi:hypothetical protein